MDIDNILYIIIAIVLAIVNGVVQKKKKEAQAQKAPTAKSFDPFAEEELLEEQLPFLFGSQKQQPEPILGNEPVTYYSKQDDRYESEEYLDSPESQFDKPEAAHFESLDVPETAEFKSVDTYQPLVFTPNAEGESAFAFDDDVISKSAITGVDEEDEVSAEATGNLLTQKHKKFNLKEAIIYSEIINPKYFTPRNNLQLNY